MCNTCTHYKYCMEQGRMRCAKYERKRGITMEDKKEICRLLLPVLQATRDLYDLTRLEYVRVDENREQVVATFWNGCTKTANVSLDSGTAMIRDIVEQIR